MIRSLAKAATVDLQARRFEYCSSWNYIQSSNIYSNAVGSLGNIHLFSHKQQVL